MADDLGYADLSCAGGTAVPTPHLDGLAAGGMRFTQFYAASAVCTPTRASILTGRYPLRFDIRQHFPTLRADGSPSRGHLPAGTMTVAKLLRARGYGTAHVGKWHLGGLALDELRKDLRTRPGPREHGFDHFLCLYEQDAAITRMTATKVIHRQGGRCLVRDDEIVGETAPAYHQNFTDAIGDEVLTLIERYHRDKKPFFLNVWTLAPHAPYEPAPEPYWSTTAEVGISYDQHCFRSMIAHLDARIGQIVARLEALGLRDKTLILFTSDNGGAYEGDVGPLKGGKADLHEGGIRVPMIANWPGRIPAGVISDQIAHSNDFLPTLCAAASVAIPADAQLDGVNLLPHLISRQPIFEADRGTLLWQLDLYSHLQRHAPKPTPYATEAARRGCWKLLCREGTPLELFDLDSDPRESCNLLEQHPDVVARLANEVREFLNAPRTAGSAAQQDAP